MPLVTCRRARRGHGPSSGVAHNAHTTTRGGNAHVFSTTSKPFEGSTPPRGETGGVDGRRAPRTPTRTFVFTEHAPAERQLYALHDTTA